MLFCDSPAEPGLVVALLAEALLLLVLEVGVPVEVVVVEVQLLHAGRHTLLIHQDLWLRLLADNQI